MNTLEHGLPEGYFYGEITDDFGDIDYALSESALTIKKSDRPPLCGGAQKHPL